MFPGTEGEAPRGVTSIAGVDAFVTSVASTGHPLPPRSSGVGEEEDPSALVAGVCVLSARDDRLMRWRRSLLLDEGSVGSVLVDGVSSLVPLRVPCVGDRGSVCSGGSSPDSQEVIEI